MKVNSSTILEIGNHYKKIVPPSIFYKWRYETLRQIIFEHSFPVTKIYKFKDEKGVVWAELAPTYLKIYPRYRWNGCSPKIALFGIFLGPPDFQKTLLASLVHDVFTQFDPEGKILPRKFYDEVFFHILKAANFKLRGLYYSGARIGSIF